MKNEKRNFFLRDYLLYGTYSSRKKKIRWKMLMEYYKYHRVQKNSIL